MIGDDPFVVSGPGVVETVVVPLTREERYRASLVLLFRRLPADARARAACVCRAWREVASSPDVVAVVDLQADRCTLRRPLGPQALLGVCRRGGKRVLALNVSGWETLDVSAVLAAAGECPHLTELRAVGLGEGARRRNCGPFHRRCSHIASDTPAWRCALAAVQVGAWHGRGRTWRH